MTDIRGAVPLSYVRKEHRPAWIAYLESKKDILWPKRTLKIDGEEGAPALTLLDANSRPLKDPDNASSVKLATMVASGKMKLEEAQFLKMDTTESTCDFSDSEDEYEDDSDYDCDDDDDSVDEGGMTDILKDIALRGN
jgi:hypothetical protein